jgi:hypothetical protein
MMRGRLIYSVGEEYNPGNPFGRNALRVEVDGGARLEHVPRGGGPTQAWTAHLDPAAIDALWTALDRAGFPHVAQHLIPAGSTMRDLVIEREGSARLAASMEWHEGLKQPGYTEAFALLDRAVRQMSGETVRLARASGEPIVGDISRT